MARSLGTGGATGLGSIVYALTAMSTLLGDQDLIADSHQAAELFTDDLIGADKQLGILGGNAGGILGLLRLYRDSHSREVLARAIKCGDYLLGQRRVGSKGCRSWVGEGLGMVPLNGMSHGAAGFAYALASLAAASGREEFAEAALECVEFENSSYDAKRSNWPDFRGEGERRWPCQWCHGAPGIGLARIAMARHSAPNAERLKADVHKALRGAERNWLSRTDTLCCGTLGGIEFFCEAGRFLRRGDLRELASRKMVAIISDAALGGPGQWGTSGSRFNLGLFRGNAGAGYTGLRRVDHSLPNVLIWE